ncbi:MAG: hypothetical protein ABI613_07365 [Gemmatimonadota bacterium]
MFIDPLLRHPIQVRMWNGERCRGDVAIPGQSLDLAGIPDSEWPENEPGGVQDGLVHMRPRFRITPNVEGAPDATDEVPGSERKITMALVDLPSCSGRVSGMPETENGCGRQGEQ